jgi:hypothetical protein
VITSSLTASAFCGEAFSYYITASNAPTSFSATGLPAGLSINTSTGEISGTPTGTGVFNVTIGAMNAFGSDSETLVITTNAAVTFNTTSVVVNEDDGTYLISVDAGCTGSHTVDIVVTGGTATSGSEYTYSTVTASFVSASTFTTSITLLDNSTCDGNTELTLGFNGFSGAIAAGRDSILTISIADDELNTGVTIAEQDFEGGGWSYSTNGDGPNTTYGRLSTNGIRIGGDTEGITLNPISVAGSSNMLLTIRNASVGGIENADKLEVYVNLDGAGFPVTPDITIQESVPGFGSVNVSWPYNASRVASTIAGTPITYFGDGALGYATIEITIPDGTSTVAVSIESNNNSGTEYYYIDDIELTGDACATCAEPTLQTTLNLGAVTSTSANLSWAAGNGSGRLSVISTGPITDDPADGSTYSANSIYGSGSTIGTNQYVVNAGPSGSVSVTGLTPGTQYYTKNWEYNCSAGSEDYLLTGAPSIDFVTPPNSPAGFDELCMRNTEVELSWSAPAGSYDGFLLVVRQGAAPHSVASLDPATQTFNLDYSSAPTFGSTSPNSRVLYNGIATSATITGLTQGLDYTFELFAYKNGVSDFAYSSGTSLTRTIEQSDVSAFVGLGLDQQASLSWANPNALCWDAIVILASTSPVTHIPSGNGSLYSADTAYGSGYNPTGAEFVVYNGTGSSVDVGNLLNDTDYYFRAFTRSGSSWSAGNEIIVTPSTATILEKGDLAIVAVNTSILSGDDEICFVAFKDLNTGTAIDFTDNGYERVNAGEWGDTEGVIRLTRTGGAISAGTTICIQGSGNDDLDFDVYICGVLDNAGWEITTLNSTLYTINLNNSNDPIWVMQGGNWVNPGGSHDATYVGGNILYGWTPAGWEAAPGYASTSGSTLFPRMQCFSTDVQSSTFIDKVKYTGPMTIANRREWIGRFNDPSNWTGYSDNSNYNSGPDYDGSCISFLLDTVSLEAGYWYGDVSSNWFDCSNWGDLSVPDSSTNVFIGPATITHQPDVDDAAAFSIDYNHIAETGNLKLFSGSLSGSDSLDVISVHGNLFISDGAALDLDNGTGATLALYGDFIDSTVTGQGLQFTNSTLVLKGGGNHSFLPTDTPYTLHNLVADKTGYGVIALQGPVLVKNRLGLEHGVIVSDQINYLELDSTGYLLNSTLNSFGLADLGNGSSFIDGPLRIRKPHGDTSPIFFPVGDNGVYSPIEIIPGTILPQTYIGQYFNSGYGNYTLDMSQTPALNQVSQVEYWEMDGVSNAPGGKDLRMRLYCSASNALCNTYFGQDSLRVAHFRSDLSNWRLEALSHTEGTVSGWRYIESSGFFTTLSPFTFGVETQGNPLPAELVNFEVFPTNEGRARLEWITSLEINNEGFEVQRSKDGIEFETIGWIDGNGNSTNTNYYTAFDNSPYKGQSYYRLKQIDFDGTTAYSPIRNFFLDGKANSVDLEIEVFPIPAQDQLYVNLIGSIDGTEIQIELANMLGQTILKTKKAETGKRGFVLDVSDLPRGNYLLKVSYGDRFEVEQIQLQ